MSSLTVYPAPLLARCSSCLPAYPSLSVAMSLPVTGRAEWSFFLPVRRHTFYCISACERVRQDPASADPTQCMAASAVRQGQPGDQGRGTRCGKRSVFSIPLKALRAPVLQWHSKRWPRAIFVRDARFGSCAPSCVKAGLTACFPRSRSAAHNCFDAF